MNIFAQRRVTLICPKSFETRIQEIFKETILPPSPENLMYHEEFASHLDESSYPNPEQEYLFFSPQRPQCMYIYRVSICTHNYMSYI